MYKQPEWGTVNLGVDVLQGHGEQSQPGKADYDKNHPGSKHKQQYNPGRNQELNLPPELFVKVAGERENPHSPAGKVVNFSGIHQRIKELLGEGIPRKEAIAKAKQEASETHHGDVGTITTKEVMAKKYQAEQPWKKASVFSDQVQGYPFI